MGHGHTRRWDFVHFSILFKTLGCRVQQQNILANTHTVHVYSDTYYETQHIMLQYSMLATAIHTNTNKWCTLFIIYLFEFNYCRSTVYCFYFAVHMSVQSTVFTATTLIQFDGMERPMILHRRIQR